MTVSAFRDNPGIQKYPTNAREWSHWINEVQKWIAAQADITTLQADVIEAGANGDLKTFGVSVSFVWWSDGAGVFPASDPTRDLVVVFNTDGSQVATRTIRGSLTSATGEVSAVSIATTGEATTVAILTDGSGSTRADVTHTASGAIGSASFSSFDQSVSGGSPGSGGSK